MSWLEKINKDVSFTGFISFKKKELFLCISVLSVGLLLLLNLARIGPKLIKDSKVLLLSTRLSLSSSDRKLRQRIGPEVYDYYKFIKDNTPENARILIPPQGLPWPRIGNAAYSRYFLYPRYLISGEEKEPGIDLKKENIQYIMVSWGEVNLFQYGYTYGWPKFKVPAKKVISITLANNLSAVEPVGIIKDFDPQNIAPGTWGIIEVDRDKL